MFTFENNKAYVCLIVCKVLVMIFTSLLCFGPGSIDMCVRKQRIDYVIVWICINCPESNRGCNPLHTYTMHLHTHTAHTLSLKLAYGSHKTIQSVHTMYAQRKRMKETEVKICNRMCRHNNYLFSDLNSHIFCEYKQNILKSVTYLSMHKPLATNSLSFSLSLSLAISLTPARSH